MFTMRHGLKGMGVAILTGGVLVATLLLIVAAPARAGLGASTFNHEPSTSQSAAPARAGLGTSTFDLQPSTFHTPSAWVIPNPAYRIYIAADGIYQLTYSDLSTAGLPVDSIDPHSFRMFYMGREAAIRVLGEEDGTFDPGDAVIFYGRGVDAMYFEGLTPINKYTGTNVYWLTYGGPAGLRMATKDGSGAGDPPDPFRHVEHLEFNIAQVSPTYFSNLPFEPDAEHWYRDWFLTGTGGTPTRPAYTFDANNIAPGPQASAVFTASVLGINAVQHQVRFYLNGNLILDDGTSGTGRALFQTSVQVPFSYLVEGTNAISVELVSPNDQIYLNWMKLEYYDQHVAEGDRLAFSSEVSGTWRYNITQFSTDSIEVYDVSELIAPQVITNTLVTGGGPYAVEFGDATLIPASCLLLPASCPLRRYMALTPAARQTPAGIEAVNPAISAYTPVDLLSPNQGADYIIITHRDFFTVALRLADYRSLHYRVKVIDAQAIYDQFNGGLMSAEAIHDFLAYAYATWVRPAPSYVVLLGDGSYDLRRYKGLSSNRTFIPPYLALVDPSLGETATDNRFVTLAGGDLIPDMNIGRLPVNTISQANAMVDKIIAYETQCNCVEGGWNQNLLFVTDDLEGGGGDFYDYSDQIALGYTDPPTDTISLIPSTYTVTRAYLGQTCDVVGNPSPATGCRSMITRTLNITGALFVSYVGHSTKSEWAAERLLDTVMVNSLTPKACLPIMLPMTCYEGSFQEASSSIPVLAESYTRAAGRGAIAGFSPTGFGLASGHDLLERGIFLAVFHEGVETLGAAATRAKQYLAENDLYGSYSDLMDTFLLLGDPGLRIKTGAACNAPTGIAVAGLQAQAHGQGIANAPGIRVSWQTNSEAEVLGFNVLRATPQNWGAGGAEGDYIAINPALIFAQASGSNSGASYVYDDAQVITGRSYSYLLEIIQLDGSRVFYGPADATVLPWRIYLP